MEQPLLGMRDAINQQSLEHTTVVVVAAAELSHNAAGHAYTVALLYRHLGHPVTVLGSHYPQWERQLWEPIRGAVQQQASDARGLQDRQVPHDLQPRLSPAFSLSVQRASASDQQGR